AALAFSARPRGRIPRAWVDSPQDRSSAFLRLQASRSGQMFLNCSSGIITIGVPSQKEIAAMRDASDAVDAYLTNRFGFGLERLLLDACAGRPAACLAGTVAAACDPVGTFEYEDGGSSALYQ